MHIKLVPIDKPSDEAAVPHCGYWSIYVIRQGTLSRTSNGMTETYGKGILVLRPSSEQISFTFGSNLKGCFLSVPDEPQFSIDPDCPSYIPLHGAEGNSKLRMVDGYLSLIKESLNNADLPYAHAETTNLCQALFKRIESYRK